MNEYIELVCVPVMTSSIYWIMATLKFAFKNNAIFLRLVPLLSLILGAIMGAVLFYVVPDMIMSENIVIAILMGGSSGLTSIGAEELIKKVAPLKKSKAVINIDSEPILDSQVGEIDSSKKNESSENINASEVGNAAEIVVVQDNIVDSNISELLEKESASFKIVNRQTVVTETLVKKTEIIKKTD